MKIKKGMIVIYKGEKCEVTRIVNEMCNLLPLKYKHFGDIKTLPYVHYGINIKDTEVMSERPKGEKGQWYTLTSDFYGWGKTENRKAGFTWQCKELSEFGRVTIDGVVFAGDETYRLATPDEIARAKREQEPKKSMGAVSSRTFEYRAIDHDMFDEDEIRTINSMGSKGWEIIRILEPIKWLNDDRRFVRIYYKREKQS